MKEKERKNVKKKKKCSQEYFLECVTYEFNKYEDDMAPPKSNYSIV